MKIIAFLIFIVLSITAQGQTPSQLPTWEKGYLDVHFINTGCGNCAFAILPDGTTLLIDAGELDPTSPRTLSPRNTRRYPNYSQHAYQWQADYIQKMFPKGKMIKLDYVLITHYHGDHFGTIYPDIKKSEKGDYYLTGITGIGDKIQISTLIDRGDTFPYNLHEYTIKNKDKSETLLNYWNFIAFHEKNSGLKHQALEIGSNSQFKLLYAPSEFPNFQIRNINASGIIWSGKENNSHFTRLPEFKQLEKNNRVPDENTLSCGILFQYGKFKLFAGGDIHGPQPEYMKYPDWYDIETPVAPIVGEVDVTTANHHANRDAMSEYYLSKLKPRVIIQEVWSSDHPGHETLLRMTSRNIWPDERDLFATNMLDANQDVIGELIQDSYKSTNGHIVLRVLPGGDKYFIYILNSSNTIREVTGIYGPYQSK